MSVLLMADLPPTTPSQYVRASDALPFAWQWSSVDTTGCSGEFSLNRLRDYWICFNSMPLTSDTSITLSKAPRPQAATKLILKNNLSQNGILMNVAKVWGQITLDLVHNSLPSEHVSSIAVTLDKATSTHVISIYLSTKHEMFVNTIRNSVGEILTSIEGAGSWVEAIQLSSASVHAAAKARVGHKKSRSHPQVVSQPFLHQEGIRQQPQAPSAVCDIQQHRYIPQGPSLARQPYLPNPMCLALALPVDFPSIPEEQILRAERLPSPLVNTVVDSQDIDDLEVVQPIQPLREAKVEEKKISDAASKKKVKLAFICKDVLYPVGLRRKYRRAVLFEGKLGHEGVIVCGARLPEGEYPDGDVTMAEYAKLLKIASDYERKEKMNKNGEFKSLTRTKSSDDLKRLVNEKRDFHLKEKCFSISTGILASPQ